MANPRRWFDDGAPPEIQRLLHAARNDLPPRRTVERTVLLVGSASAIGTAAGSALGGVGQAATSSLGLAIVKWGAAAVLGLGLTTAAVSTVRQSPRPATAATAHPMNWTVTPKSGVVAAFGVAPSAAVTVFDELPAMTAEPAENAGASHAKPLASHAALAPADETMRSRLGVAVSAREPPQAIRKAEPGLRVPPRPTDSQPSVDPASDTQLQQELHLLDQARTALFKGQPMVAIHWLNQYQRSCAAQRLLPEALLIRMQVAVRLGDTSSAAQVAGEICTRFPASPHAARAKEFLDSRSQQLAEQPSDDN